MNERFWRGSLDEWGVVCRSYFVRLEEQGIGVGMVLKVRVFQAASAPTFELLYNHWH